jgi:hypothetical protein
MYVCITEINIHIPTSLGFTETYHQNQAGDNSKYGGSIKVSKCNLPKGIIIYRSGIFNLKDSLFKKPLNLFYYKYTNILCNFYYKYEQ